MAAEYAPEVWRCELLLYPDEHGPRPDQPYISTVCITITQGTGSTQETHRILGRTCAMEVLASKVQHQRMWATQTKLLSGLSWSTSTPRTSSEERQACVLWIRWGVCDYGRLGPQGVQNVRGPGLFGS